jgi:hypothetical protein
MFEVVKDVHFTWDSFSGYYLVGLGHLSCLVDLALVIYLNFDLNPLLLCLLVGWAHHIGDTCWVGIIETRVVLSGVLWWLERYFNFDYLNVVLLIVRSVRAYEKSLHREITAVGTKCNQISFFCGSGGRKGNLHVSSRHPFNCERGPSQRVWVKRVIQKGSMLLPDLIFFEDSLLFNFIHIVD